LPYFNGRYEQLCVGRQDVAVQAHHAKTPQAEICVRINTALVYLHDAAIAKAMHEAFASRRSDLRRVPPVVASTRFIRSGTDKRPLGVVAHVEDGIHVHSATLRGNGNVEPHFRIGFEDFTLDIRDRVAFIALAGAFRHAHELARETFLVPMTMPEPRLGHAPVDQSIPGIHAVAEGLYMAGRESLAG
jgi:hypothetical protein